MPPPQLPADARVADVSVPGLEGFGVAGGEEFELALPSGSLSRTRRMARFARGGCRVWERVSVRVSVRSRERRGKTLTPALSRKRRGVFARGRVVVACGRGSKGLAVLAGHGAQGGAGEAVVGDLHVPLVA